MQIIRHTFTSPFGGTFFTECYQYQYQKPRVYSYDEMRDIITPFISLGQGREIKSIISSFGVGKLSQIPVEKTEEFVMRVLEL